MGSEEESKEILINSLIKKLAVLSADGLIPAATRDKAKALERLAEQVRSDQITQEDDNVSG